MKARTYGVLLLAVAGLAPVGVFGYLATTRSERSEIAQARDANQRLARLVADRVGAYLAAERTVLSAIGTAALLADDAADATATLQAYGLNHPYFHDIQVFRPGRTPWAAQDETRVAPSDVALVERALAGRPAHSAVVPADAHRPGPFAHTLMLAQPVVIAGKLEGAVLARMDLVGIWPPIQAIQVGRSGFVRLLTADGELLAHGDPEERRFVFSENPEGDAALMAGALLGLTVVNHQGRRVLASLAFVPGIDWVVVVEQSVEEAYQSASTIRRTLLVFMAVALACVLLFGALLGRKVVRGLEELREHTRVLADGALDKRVEPSSRLEEVQALADALNEMAASLQRLEEEARARDRLTTFARISAGLAHDLKAPIEAIRGAWEAMAQDPMKAADQELVRRVHDRELPRLRDYMDDLHRLAARGELERELSRVNPGELVAEVIEDLGTNPRWSGVSFEARGRAEATLMERKLVRRAVFNLAANGADACLEADESGTVVIEVSTAAGGVAFRVIDTGPGIPADRAKSLATVDFGSTKRSTGVGLGLGVVRQVAAAHGGRLEITSEIGSGSTFTLVLSQTGGPAPRREAVS